MVMILGGTTIVLGGATIVETIVEPETVTVLSTVKAGWVIVLAGIVTVEGGREMVTPGCVTVSTSWEVVVMVKDSVLPSLVTVDKMVTGTLFVMVDKETTVVGTGTCCEIVTTSVVPSRVTVERIVVGTGTCRTSVTVTTRVVPS